MLDGLLVTNGWQEHVLMPVSPHPILVPLVMLCAFAGGLLRIRLTYGRCRAIRHIAIVVVLLFLPALGSQINGMVLRQLAAGGDAKWQLAYADWYIAERNLHQELMLAPSIPWDGDHFFQYLSDSAAQGYVPAMRKYMAWVEQSPARMDELRVRATYNNYKRQLGDTADYSYWRESTLLNDLIPLYALIAIAVQVLFWREEARFQQEFLARETADAGTPANAFAGRT